MLEIMCESSKTEYSQQLKIQLSKATEKFITKLAKVSVSMYCSCSHDFSTICSFPCSRSFDFTVSEIDTKVGNENSVSFRENP